MTTVEELQEALIVHLNDNEAHIGRNSNTMGPYLQSFIEANVETILHY